MNEITWVKSLSSPAPHVPAIDVSQRVLASLPAMARPRPDRAATLIWSLAAALGLTASTAAGIIAFSLIQSASDPAQSIANTWSTVLQ